MPASGRSPLDGGEGKAGRAGGATEGRLGTGTLQPSPGIPGRGGALGALGKAGGATDGNAGTAIETPIGGYAQALTSSCRWSRHP